MKKDFSIIIAEDDDGHFVLIKKNLSRMGFRSKIIRFSDGQQLLDFLFMRDENNKRDPAKAYLLLLDIRMPKVDGISVLEEMKKDDDLKEIPVVMLTTADNPREIEYCLSLGCSDYIVKSMKYENFAKVIKDVGLSLLFSIVEMSEIANE